MYKPPKNRLNYCNRMSSYSTAATCNIPYSIIPIESTRQIEINFGCVFIFIICGVTWWYIKYIQFVRGHAFSTGGRVNGKGGVNWVWTPPPLAKKIETFKSTFWHKITEKSLEPLPSPAPNLEQNITWILWENV